MRRTPEATLLSDLMRKGPALAVLSRWVPPQNSMEKSPISTTRTVSPYFSPKMATAPLLLGLLNGQVLGHDRDQPSRIGVVDQIAPPRRSCSGRDGLKVGEVEAQAIRLHQRACLMHVVAQHLLQRRVQQVGGAVGAADGLDGASVSMEAVTVSPTFSSPCCHACRSA